MKLTFCIQNASENYAAQAYYQKICPTYDSRGRLLIDSSSLTLKCVLLRNANQYPSIPVGHSILIKDYKNVNFLQESNNYARHK